MIIVYDYLVHLKDTEIQSAIVNDILVDIYRKDTATDFINAITGEVLITLENDNTVCHCNDMVWATAVCDLPAKNEISMTYTRYSRSMDITFIFEEAWTVINGRSEQIRYDVTGFYHGEPDEKYTKMYQNAYVRRKEVK